MQTVLTGLGEITQKFKEIIERKESEIIENIKKGDFISFEKELKELTDNFAKDLTESILTEAVDSPEMEQKTKDIAASKRLKVRKTKVKIYIWNGQQIEIPSYYGFPKPNYTKKKKKRKRKRGPNGNGCHLLLDYWGFLSKSSPSCYSLVALLTVICPSFDLAVKVMEQQGITLNSKTVRRIALALGKRSMKYRVLLNVGKTETLAGKRVIISVDGGRTRIRIVKKGTDNESLKYPKFDTPWKEPKLLVIQQIDENGQIDKKSLPIYDTVLGNATAIFKLLADYLKQLNLKEADKVLFIGDGAKWIWNRTKKLFKDLGLQSNQYIETIDYYHAVQHLYKTIELLPAKNLADINKSTLIEQMKKLLWEGNISSLVKRLKELGKGNLPTVNSKLNFYAKQPKLFNYSYLKKIKMPCGSGIVESAIRRIINLRFKAPSSFWLPENVEPLMFLRGVALAGRWNNFIHNFANFKR